jgi:hypothetical protein
LYTLLVTLYGCENSLRMSVLMSSCGAVRLKWARSGLIMHTKVLVPSLFTRYLLIEIVLFRRRGASCPADIVWARLSLRL